MFNTMDSAKRSSTFIQHVQEAHTGFPINWAWAQTGLLNGLVLGPTCPEDYTRHSKVLDRSRMSSVWSQLRAHYQHVSANPCGASHGNGEQNWLGPSWVS